jgi:hypothetical protein
MQNLNNEPGCKIHTPGMSKQKNATRTLKSFKFRYPWFSRRSIAILCHFVLPSGPPLIWPPLTFKSFYRRQYHIGLLCYRSAKFMSTQRSRTHVLQNRTSALWPISYSLFNTASSAVFLKGFPWVGREDGAIEPRTCFRNCTDSTIGQLGYILTTSISAPSHHIKELASGPFFWSSIWPSWSLFGER